MNDGWSLRLHKWFPFLHSWRLFEDRDSPYRQCVTCGHMQMMTKGSVAVTNGRGTGPTE
jgi:hypothetical protein